MKSTRKNLQLSMEYGDLGEAIRCLENVAKELRKSQTNFGRQIVNGVIIQWGVYNLDFPDHRIEVKEGKTCMIIPSKMNKS
jgi:hypothetical protein